MSVKPADLQQVDYLEVLVLVDNVMDILSSVPDCVTSEIPDLIKAGQKNLTVLENTAYISGEIPRVTDYEKGLPSQVRLDTQGNWVPDTLQLDERYVAVNVKDRGIVVFSACSHAGVVNVLTDAADVSPAIPLYAVMGGLHLSGPNHEPTIPNTVQDIARFNLKRLVVGHCTGWRAFQALVNAYGDAVIPEAVGHTHHFGAAS